MRRRLASAGLVCALLIVVVPLIIVGCGGSADRFSGARALPPDFELAEGTLRRARGSLRALDLREQIRRTPSVNRPFAAVAIDRRSLRAEHARSMTSAAPSSTAFAYIDCDVPVGQTLVQWRREREAARRADRPARRSLRVLLLRWARAT